MEIVKLTEENQKHFGMLCVKNKKHEGYIAKKAWLEDLETVEATMKVLVINGKMGGFIEYIDGEHAWRAVDSKGYLFIHCLWIQDKNSRGQGYASALIQQTIEDAKELGFNGVATMCSEDSWITSKAVFEKNGFEEIEAKEGFELLIYSLNKDAEIPKLNDWVSQREKYQGLNLIYSSQCPYFIKASIDLAQTAEDAGIPLFLHELKTAKEAQNSPAGYGGFCIIYDGKLIEQHYISKTRFNNILSKEIFTELI